MQQIDENKDYLLKIKLKMKELYILLILKLYKIFGK